MKRIPRHSEDHEPTDRWLLTYADLITLLLGLFVILYAMSKIDVEKYSGIVQALGERFGDGPKALAAGSAGVLPPEGVVPARYRIEQEIRQALPQQTGRGDITLSQSERGITVHLAEHLLFPSGSADLKPEALAALDTLARVLRSIPNDIRIEGHTDDVPISVPAYPSNWHLSVSRAVNTAFYLIGRHSVKPDKVSVVGYSEYRPLVPNSDWDNRARNRRVDIVIVTDVGQNLY